MVAWYAGAIVRYGCAQSPKIPSRRNSAALDVDEPERVRPAAPALLGRIHGAAHVAPGLVEPELLVDLMLDGQPVAVPARHVDGIVAEHRPRLDHDVLEDLVERGPHVDVPVRVGRAVVEDPARAALPAGAQLAVEVGGLPAAEELRLPLGQVRPHGEVGPGEVEGRLVVHESENCAAAARRAVDESVASTRTCVKERAGSNAAGAVGVRARRRPRAQPPGAAGQASGAGWRARCHAVSYTVIVAAPATTLWARVTSVTGRNRSARAVELGKPGREDDEVLRAAPPEVAKHARLALPAVRQDLGRGEAHQVDHPTLAEVRERSEVVERDERVRRRVGRDPAAERHLHAR